MGSWPPREIASGEGWPSMTIRKVTLLWSTVHGLAVLALVGRIGAA